MKKVFVLFVGALVSASSCAYAQSNEPFTTYTFAPVVASNIRMVEANTSGGSITVNGTDGSEAVVEVNVTRASGGANLFNFRRNRATNENIKQLFEENYTVDVKVENGKLYAVARPNSRTLSNAERLNISFNITVPGQINSNLQTSGGSIRIRNLSGSQDFRTSGGSMTIENVTGDIVGRTSGGSITVANSSGTINLRTSGGSITARDCRGVINLGTSGGSLNLSNLIGDVDATTSGGSVTARNMQGALKAGTSGGSMNVDMVSVSEHVILSTSGGSISLNLPANRGYALDLRANRVNTSELRNFSGNQRNNRVEGTVGNGGPNVSARTSGGRVNLSFN